MSRWNTRSAVLLACVLCVQSQQVRAAEPAQRHHVIVLLDRSKSMLENATAADLDSAITHVLPQLCFTPVVLTGNRPRALFDAAHGDLLSVLAFGFDYRTATSFDGFISTSSVGGILRTPNASQATFDRLWSGVHDEGLPTFYSRSWSGIALAIPLALGQAAGGAAAEPVGRTFVILVSDDQFNGGDPSLELVGLRSDLRNLSGSIPTWQRLTASMATVQDRVDETRKYYLFQPMGDDHMVGGVHLKVFEAIPNTWAFAIESVWDFERSFRFRRVPRGFRGEFPLRRLGRGPMQPFRGEAVLLQRGREVDRQVFESSADTVVRFSLPRSAASDGLLQVRMRFWVRFADRVYGMQLLSPDGSELQGREGLVRTVPVALERPARVVGIIPLPFWAFSTASAVGFNSQGAATWFWNVLLLVLAAAALVFWIWWAGTERSALAFVAD